MWTFAGCEVRAPSLAHPCRCFNFSCVSFVGFAGGGGLLQRTHTRWYSCFHIKKDYTFAQGLSGAVLWGMDGLSSGYSFQRRWIRVFCVCLCSSSSWPMVVLRPLFKLCAATRMKNCYGLPAVSSRFYLSVPAINQQLWKPVSDHEA